MVLVRYWNSGYEFIEDSPFFEIRSAEQQSFPSGVHAVKTGLKIEVPADYVLHIFPRGDLIQAKKLAFFPTVYKGGSNGKEGLIYNVQIQAYAAETDESTVGIEINEVIAFGYLVNVSSIDWEYQGENIKE